MFEKYGDVEKCQIMRDPHTKESRGFGFVKMVTSDQADAAKEGLTGEVVEGRTFNIEKARRSRPRTPTPGKYFGPPKRGKQTHPVDALAVINRPCKNPVATMIVMMTAAAEVTAAIAVMTPTATAAMIVTMKGVMIVATTVAMIVVTKIVALTSVATEGTTNVVMKTVATTGVIGRAMSAATVTMGMGDLTATVTIASAVMAFNGVAVLTTAVDPATIVSVALIASPGMLLNQAATVTPGLMAVTTTAVRRMVFQSIGSSIFFFPGLTRLRYRSQHALD